MLTPCHTVASPWITLRKKYSRDGEQAIATRNSELLHSWIRTGNTIVTRSQGVPW